LIFAFVVAGLALETNPFVAQEKFSVLTGKVLGIRTRLWLDVQSEKDKVTVNLRIGRKTVYIPGRYLPIPEKE